MRAVLNEAISLKKKKKGQPTNNCTSLYPVIAAALLCQLPDSSLKIFRFLSFTPELRLVPPRKNSLFVAQQLGLYYMLHSLQAGQVGLFSSHHM